MIEKLMHRYALSRRGAKDLIKGIVACTLQNISFMFPVTLLYLFVKALLNGNVRNNTTFFVGGAIICLFVIFCITLWQYNSTFLATYVETGTRRLYVPADFDTREKALSGAKAAEKGLK